MGVEVGIPYTFIGEDGTRAVVGPGAEGDPDFCGYLDAENGITGLASAPVRENASPIVEGHGGAQGPNYWDRLQPGFSGILNPNVDAQTRNGLLDKLARATTALRSGDGVVRWTNTGEQIERAVWWRTQNAIVPGSRFPKTWQVALASEDWKATSYKLFDSRDLNRLPDSGFEGNPTGTILSAYVAPPGGTLGRWGLLVASGATGDLTVLNTRVLGGAVSGRTHVTTIGAGGQIGPAQAVALPAAWAGLPVTFSAYMSAATLLAGRLATPVLSFLDSTGAILATTPGLAAAPSTSWTRLSASAIPPAGTAYVQVWVPLSGLVAGDEFHVDNAQLEQAPAPTPYAVGDNYAISATSMLPLTVTNEGSADGPLIAVIGGPVDSGWTLGIGGRQIKVNAHLISPGAQRFVYLYPPDPGLLLLDESGVNCDGDYDPTASDDLLDLMLKPGANSVTLTGTGMSAGVTRLYVQHRHAWRS